MADAGVFNENETKKELVWLITGTSSGLGRRLVHEALRRGDRVVATARNLDSIKNLLDDSALTESARNRLHILRLDLDEGTAQITTAVDEAARFWGRLDVVVNNAGTGLKGLIEESGSHEFRKQFQTNFFGLIDVTNAALPYLRRQRSGTVVLVGSRMSWAPEMKGAAMYSSSKVAVRTFGDTLAIEVAPFSIKVLIVEPAAFAATNLGASPFIAHTRIEDYDTLRAEAMAGYETVPAQLDGDPAKAMRLLADVVRGEGVARGRAWPLYLPMGAKAVQAVRTKCEKVLGVVGQWEDVLANLNFDEGTKPNPPKSA